MKLEVALTRYPHTRSLVDGSITLPGYELDFVDVGGPINLAFRRMVRSLEFDVCEMSITTYMAAKQYGRRFTAIPAFPVRLSPHDALVLSAKAGVTEPKELEGKRVGVRAYTVTLGVWARGVLSDQYGVDVDKVTWVINDEEHVQEFEYPSNVVSLPGADLASMVASGELAAGIGVGTPDGVNVTPLVNERDQMVAAWLARGIYPINHTVVVRDELLEADPGLATALYSALYQAKAEFMERLSSVAALDEDERALAARRSVVGPDPIPYGIEANRASLEALIRFARQQHILREDRRLEELFLASKEA